MFDKDPFNIKVIVQGKTFKVNVIFKVKLTFVSALYILFNPRWDSQIRNVKYIELMGRVFV